MIFRLSKIKCETQKILSLFYVITIVTIIFYTLCFHWHFILLNMTKLYIKIKFE